MNASQLKYMIESIHPRSRFFSRENMKFAGDTMANYGVRSAVVLSNTGDTVKCWELYRKRPVKHGLQTSAYFCQSTYRQLFEQSSCV